MSDSDMTVNGVEYVRKDSVGAVVEGDRVILVVDRGWVFCGDVQDVDGRIFLHRALHVLRWESIGFAGLVNGGDSSSITTKRVESVVDIPKDAEVFRVPVDKDWGL